jgi:ABC-2 type transport system ATP-binding protein
MIGTEVEFAIEMRRLTKRFGKFTAVDHLDLCIKQGQLYALLGPNGSGKTTAIKMVVGILKPTEGEVYVLGSRIPNREVVTDIGYMPQETAVYEDLTVGENMRFMGEIYGLSRERIKEREKDILAFVELEKWKDEVVSNLSGGMKHRTSLACALIPNPKVLILDEPTVGVDPELRALFWAHFKKLRDTGTTVIITTHYMDEARNCEKVGFLREGKLIIQGEPGTIMLRTSTTNLEDAFLAVERGEVKIGSAKE